jgi:hypothetical protein
MKIVILGWSVAFLASVIFIISVDGEIPGLAIDLKLFCRPIDRTFSQLKPRFQIDLYPLLRRTGSFACD